MCEIRPIGRSGGYSEASSLRRETVPAVTTKSPGLTTAPAATLSMIRSRGLPGLGLTVPKTLPSAVVAATAVEESVIRRTTADEPTTWSTLPISPAFSEPSPSAAITGWPGSIPAPEPLLIVIFANHSVGERVTTCAETGPYGVRSSLETCSSLRSLRSLVFSATAACERCAAAR